MTDHRDWTGRVGTIWAHEWRRTDRSFRELTPRLLQAIEADDYDSALDIGCGAGEISCALAEAHPDRRITGLDISSELLEVARERGRTFGNLAFVQGDAATGTTGHPSQRLVSRHGVMFFAEPEVAFAHLRNHSGPETRLTFSCFRARSENEWDAATLSALPDPPAPPVNLEEPGPFAFGNRDRVAAILGDAGWKEITFDSIDYRMVFGAGEDPVADACDYLTRVGPTAMPIAALGDAARHATIERLAEVLERYRVGAAVAIPAAAWIVSARA
ncbi:methyltransferase domain-containing protein [Porphyrobacter algicida]|uniref:Methyltransferase domain-containing protein n=1 Tax=Qipengyuania algicida TaxID=1836209 RepID=A0A845AQ87_9SPHN|nr:class I SAM-dependent methyltransferase [Qipengyuania algicida]MXP29098.1 methyltransferase domain-containing protein [Qipengyuania algicida]